MFHTLADHIGWCECGDRVIVLDLEADRYLSLTGPAATTLVALGAHPLSIDTPHMASFSARGWLVPQTRMSYAEPRAAVALPIHDALDEGHPDASWRAIARATWFQMRATRALRRRRLIGILRGMRMAQVPSIPATPAAMARARAIAAAFASSVPLMGSIDRCLPRAIALSAMAHHDDIRPMLVFGVCADPFAAHCWVQLDGTVLTGDLDQARQFTPILAVS